MKSVFTVYFEGPYWVGVLERVDEAGYWVARYVFGGEPTNAELWQFAAREFAEMRATLVEPTEGFDPNRFVETKRNVKSSVRRASREQRSGLDSYTHVALQNQLQQRKKSAKEQKKARDEQRRDNLYALSREKNKAKKRGH